MTEQLRPGMVGSVIEISVVEFSREALVGRLAAYQTDKDWYHIWFQGVSLPTKLRKEQIADVSVWNMPVEVRVLGDLLGDS